MENDKNFDVNLSAMNEEEFYEWRNSLDVNSLGFTSEREGMIMSDEDIRNAKLTLNAKVGSSGERNIQQNLTITNFSNSNISRIKYIVIHYTANNGDTAWGNTNYFKSTYRGASAHYFVDENPIIWQCVLDEDVAWHCGGSLESSHHPYRGICTNSNSIGIELCSRKYSNGTYYFKEETINNAAWLTRMLMDKYGISINNVIRHYDVTGKLCPRPFIDENAWQDFKNRVQNGGDELTMTQYEELLNKINEQNTKIAQLENDNVILKEAIGWTDESEPALYAYVDDNSAKISPDTNEILNKLISEGKLSVDENGFAPLSKTAIRLLVIMNR